MLQNCFVCNEEANKLECLSLAILYQPSLMFPRKTGTYTSGTPFRVSSIENNRLGLKGFSYLE